VQAVTFPIAEAVRHGAIPLEGSNTDYDAVIDRAGDARFVLIGEASHGTQEFCHERARITQRLIREKKFNAVAAEADWPDAWRVNRYVRGDGPANGTVQSLDGFRRFPAWMWRNTEVRDFVAWMRQHNDGLGEEGAKAGFYGLDLYSMYASVEAVIDYLDREDPEAASRARYRYSCFEHFGEDSQAYGYYAGFGLKPSCEKDVVAQLVEIQRRSAEEARRDGRFPDDELFYAEQNARVVKNAEQYYRSMFQDRISSWNLRDRHMAEILDQLAAHLERTAGYGKIVVWAHNSHLGDARATEMGRAGEWNVGQLVRERYLDDSLLIGFATYNGTVTAASEWGGPAGRKRVRDALAGSYEAVLHEAAIPKYLLLLDQESEHTEALREERLERAIGVIYLPRSERISHYFEAQLPRQFDAMIHLDHTRALEPLERTSEWDAGEPGETFPTGL
jgi:erythromycin esterase-like protein